ncbi:MAG: DNA polymerase III subunit gamma/tau [Proteobacteria bacterium]|nr:DNA polymerase III subunit gamma/tau [Pseudomonadota bacterium]
MSYLVLARKSRPQTFSQVVGQRPVVRTLQNSILRNRVAHAILFSGVRGVGKTTIARIMAKAINCQAEPADRPCNLCSTCHEITAGTSFDLSEIDGASNRGIQEIRELKEKIKFLPTSAKYRIIIIDEVHMLTTEAFNALLKTLEEPPAHVYFMFATTEIHKIPITILSRCQQYELKRISAGELYDHFQKLTAMEGFEIEPAALSLIVREAGGSVRDGLSLLDQMFSFGENRITSKDVVEVLGLVGREVLMRLTSGLLEGSLPEVLTALDDILSFGLDIKRFVEDLMANFRTLMLCKIDGCAGLIDLPAEELKEFQALAAAYTRETLHLKLAVLMAMAEELRFATQPRLTLETSFLKIIESDNVVPVTTLLGHLNHILDSLPTCPPTSLILPGEDTSVSGKKDEPAVALSTPVINRPLQAPPTSPPAPEEQKESVITEIIGKDERERCDKTLAAPDSIAAEINVPEISPVKIHPHEKDVRKDWLEFIQYVKDRKVWMAQDLQRADSVKQDVEGELQLTYEDAANCSLLRQKENRQILTEFVLDFFQKTLKVKFIIPAADDPAEPNGTESPNRKRAQLAGDPLVIMAAEIFNGEVGDIRIGPHSR